MEKGLLAIAKSIDALTAVIAQEQMSRRDWFKHAAIMGMSESQWKNIQAFAKSSSTDAPARMCEHCDKIADAHL